MKSKIKILKFSGDRVVWLLCFILSTISLIAVYSSIGYTAIIDYHTTPVMAFLKKHLLYVLIAYLGAMVVSNINYQFFSRIANVLYLGAVALLFVVLVLGGRWLRLRYIGQFQPSEIAKPIVIIFIAHLLAIYHDQLNDKKLFWLTLIPLALVAGLIMPENLSTALLVFATGLAIMYLGGVKRKYIFITIALLGIAGGSMLFVSYKVFHSPLASYAREAPLIARAETWSNRIDHWLNPDKEELSQENMARMAIAEGGLIKANIGGTVHARLMTQANNDFIYAIIVEETGSIVGVIIFLLYTILFYRCMILAYKSGRRFGGLLIMGIATSIYLQAIVHICVCVGVIPVTGQTLPLISTGGTSYVFTCIGIGMIQAVVKSSNNQRKLQKNDEAAIDDKTTTEETK
ncbi:MAG: FtsW/RodA/SpoVE family cell cycle protein [Bacteroidales bacterium]|nr:FtsW/RodA/SpoVE family cell cycle protein [Bacteroidales bacterium]